MVLKTLFDTLEIMGARLSVNMCSATLASLFDVRVCEVCKGEVCDASG